MIDSTEPVQYEPITYKDQIEILKSRGCKIDDEESCMEKLSNINYYRFISYLLPFKQKDGRYQPGTSFHHAYNLYEFDRKLRNLLYEAIEVIEVSLRTKITYLHSHTYGPLGYLDEKNFNSNHRHKSFIKKIYSEVRRNKDILRLKPEVKNSHTKLPLWIVSELFTFGMVSCFYYDLKTKDQKTMARKYHVGYKNLRSWLRCLTDLRNICAHSGRLYYRVFTAAPANLHLSEARKRRLWGQMLVLKNVYPSRNKWNLEFFPSLLALFDEYKDYINLYHIAFPKDWDEQLMK